MHTDKAKYNKRKLGSRCHLPTQAGNGPTLGRPRIQVPFPTQAGNGPTLQLLGATWGKMSVTQDAKITMDVNSGDISAAIILGVFSAKQ